MNIRMNCLKVESLGYIFAADSMGLSTVTRVRVNNNNNSDVDNKSRSRDDNEETNGQNAPVQD